jgi:endonuclease/exonuclease/phosphatase family metal-dependent hydrolase
VFRRRHEALKKFTKNTPTIQEQLFDAPLVCPLPFERMQEIAIEIMDTKQKVRHCETCKKSVYHCETKDEVQHHASLGNCITMFVSTPKPSMYMAQAPPPPPPMPTKVDVPPPPPPSTFVMGGLPPPPPPSHEFQLMGGPPPPTRFPTPPPPVYDFEIPNAPPLPPFTRPVTPPPPTFHMMGGPPPPMNWNNRPPTPPLPPSTRPPSPPPEQPWFHMLGGPPPPMNWNNGPVIAPPLPPVQPPIPPTQPVNQTNVQDELANVKLRTTGISHETAPMKEATPPTEKNCTTRPLQLVAWNSTAWEPVKTSAHSQSSVTFLTLNAWTVVEEHLQERISHVVSYLMEKNVDICALQEWSLKAQKMLQENETIRQHFNIISEEGMGPSVQPSTQKVTILSRKTLHVTSVECWDVPHSFRRVVVCKYQIDSTQLVVASTHFVSERPAIKKRAEQLKFLQERLEKNCTLVILGDFNFHAHLEDESIESIGLVDVWKQVHGRKDGHTYRLDYEFRLDRIVSNEAFKSIDIVFKEPLFGDVFVSDHYALLATMECKQEKKEKTEKKEKKEKKKACKQS